MRTLVRGLREPWGVRQILMFGDDGHTQPVAPFQEF